MFIGKVILVNTRYSLELKAFERFKSVEPNMKGYGRTFYHLIKNNKTSCTTLALPIGDECFNSTTYLFCVSMVIVCVYLVVCVANADLLSFHILRSSLKSL